MLLFLRQDFFLLLLLSAFMSFIALCIRRVALLLGGIMVVVPYCAIYIIALLALFVVLFLYHQFDSFIDLFYILHHFCTNTIMNKHSNTTSILIWI